eukprot:3074644-Pyramimonas_sp.AAC.3
MCQSLTPPWYNCTANERPQWTPTSTVESSASNAASNNGTHSVRTDSTLYARSYSTTHGNLGTDLFRQIVAFNKKTFAS